jgi:hypothetical protein
VSKWGNNKDLLSTGCSGEDDDGPDHAVSCGNQHCAHFGRGDIRCFCNTGNTIKCNDLYTFPANCDPKPDPEAEAEPGNGAEGKVGSVFSVLVATIFAAVI